MGSRAAIEIHNDTVRIVNMKALRSRELEAWAIDKNR
jgi:hypothetical protein